MVARYCPKCPAILMPQDFYRHRSDGFQRRCKECQKASVTAWQARNRERRNATVWAYAKRHPDKTAERSRRRWENVKRDPEALALWRDRNREHKRKVLGITPDRYRVVPTSTRADLVEVASVRSAFEDSGLTLVEVAARIGVNEAAVRKALSHDRMESATAARIIGALGLDPVDCGI